MSTTTEARVVAPKKKKAMRAYLILAGVAAAAVGAYYIHGYMTRDIVNTDDAQVDADVVPISVRVAGVVLELDVKDNEPVKKDQILAKLDPAEYLAKLESANGELAAANAQLDAANRQIDIVKSTSAGGLSSAKAQLQGTGASVRSAGAQVQAASAQLERARSDLAKAESELTRAKTLHDQGAITAQAFETAQAARDSAHAMVDQDIASLSSAHDMQSLAESRIAEAQGRVQQSAPVEQQIAAATAARDLAKAHVDIASAAVKTAELQKSYTTIRSPADGFASKLAARQGQMVQPGSMMLMVVPAETYVIANFKETQTERIRKDDTVDVSIDALSGTYHGKVASVSAATGARFSMMPPDNATGNFVKVVQRVPVKIVWDDGQDLSALHAGLSAEVTVHLK